MTAAISIRTSWGPWSLALDRFVLEHRDGDRIDLLHVNCDDDWGYEIHRARRSGCDANDLYHLEIALREIGAPAFHRLPEHERWSEIPPAMTAADQHGVYVLRCGERVKIGQAEDVKRRMAEIQCANGEEVTLVAMLSHRIIDERKWQAKFAHLKVRKRGEWFWFGQQILVHVYDTRRLSR
jgi:hypothetical protein